MLTDLDRRDFIEVDIDPVICFLKVSKKLLESDLLSRDTGIYQPQILKLDEIVDDILVITFQSRFSDVLEEITDVTGVAIDTIAGETFLHLEVIDKTREELGVISR